MDNNTTSEKPSSDRRKYYNCSKCRYRTDRKNNLKRHLMTMHEKCSKLLECCNLVFLNKSALKEHVTEFHAGAGYACLVCNRKFSRKALMKRHSMVHNGRREFNCHGCDYATSHKSNLDRHVKRHQTSSENHSLWFGHVFSVCNDFLSTNNLYREESEAVIKRIQRLNDSLRNDLWYHHPFYRQLIHTNLEYIKYFYKLYNFDNNLVVMKEGSDLCHFTEESERNPFLHRKGFPWIFNSCQICQQNSHFKVYYENKGIQQQQHYFLTWMNMIKSLTAKQVICSERLETLDLWSKISQEKDLKLLEDANDSISFNKFENGMNRVSDCLENSLDLLGGVDEIQNKVSNVPTFCV